MSNELLYRVKFIKFSFNSFNCHVCSYNLRSPRHLAVVYLYTMFDMCFALRRTICEISMFPKYVFLLK